MESTREAVDPRNPKRQALDRAPARTEVQEPCNSTAMAFDAAIWTTIVEFLPIPTPLDGETAIDHSSSKRNARIEHTEAAVSELVATWRTLLNLRLVSKELETLLHPVDNATLWERLLLQSFDFSVREDTFNLDTVETHHDLDNPSDQDASNEVKSDEQTEENPQLIAMQGRYDAMPAQYLDEDLANWYMLGICYRPSQYGFLPRLQQRQQPEGGEWPESEDAFTLFGDLVRLLMLPHGDAMGPGDQSGDTMLKFLGAPTEADWSSPFYRFHVMKTLGYVPHVWHKGDGISDEWMGFTEAETFEWTITEQLTDKRGYDASFSSFVDYDGCFEFPQCTVRDAKRLYQAIHAHCQDWRSVGCCNIKSMDGGYYTPVYFVGESYALPHRWIGYMGSTFWT